MINVREHFIVIDSRNRDRSLWSSSSQFEVKMQPNQSFSGAYIDRNFKNIESIELIDAIFPNTNNVTNQMYLYLCIPEIDGALESTNPIGTKALAKLVPSKLIGNYIYTTYENQHHPKKYYQSVGARLDKITVEFRQPDGSLFDFGTDNGIDMIPNPLLQTSITLRIVVRSNGI